MVDQFKLGSEWASQTLAEFREPEGFAQFSLDEQTEINNADTISKRIEFKSE